MHGTQGGYAKGKKRKIHMNQRKSLQKTMKTKIFCSFLHTMVRNYEKNLDKKLTI